MINILLKGDKLVFLYFLAIRNIIIILRYYKTIFLCFLNLIITNMRDCVYKAKNSLSDCSNKIH